MHGRTSKFEHVVRWRGEPVARFACDGAEMFELYGRIEPIPGELTESFFGALKTDDGDEVVGLLERGEHSTCFYLGMYEDGEITFKVIPGFRRLEKQVAREARKRARARQRRSGHRRARMRLPAVLARLLASLGLR